MYQLTVNPSKQLGPMRPVNGIGNAPVLGWASGTLMHYLDDAGIPYEKVLAEEVPELATKLGIRQAPTLVCGGQLYAGAGEIKKFIAQQK